jgi:hypothetical protein
VGNPKLYNQACSGTKALIEVQNHPTAALTALIIVPLDVDNSDRLMFWRSAFHRCRRAPRQ